jgi:hypothetical protein
MNLSAKMLRVLIDVSEGRGAYQECGKRGQAGGRGNTLKALRWRRLLSMENTLTDSGIELVMQLAPLCTTKTVSAPEPDKDGKAGKGGVSLLGILRRLLGKETVKP